MTDTRNKIRNMIWTTQTNERVCRVSLQQTYIEKVWILKKSSNCERARERKIAQMTRYIFVHVLLSKDRSKRRTDDKRLKTTTEKKKSDNSLLMYGVECFIRYSVFTYNNGSGTHAKRKLWKMYHFSLGLEGSMNLLIF